MDFYIRKATEADLDALFLIMKSAAENMEDPSYFAPDDRDFIKEHIENKGFILIAETAGKSVGFIIARRPGADLDNLGFDLGLPSCEMDLVWHLESAAVLTEYRGHGLQKKLILRAEEEIRAGGDFMYMLSTVHPDNDASRKSLEKCGFTLKKAALKYGGKLRYIMGKEV